MSVKFEDGITVTLATCFSWPDRFRILVTGKVFANITVDTEHVVGATRTKHMICACPVFPRKQLGKIALLEDSP